MKTMVILTALILTAILFVKRKKFILCEVTTIVNNQFKKVTSIRYLKETKTKNVLEMKHNRFYVPKKGNSLFLGRTIFKIEEETGTRYDYNGYEPLTDAEMKKAFDCANQFACI